MNLYGMTNLPKDAAKNLIKPNAKTLGTLGELTVAAQLNRVGFATRKQREGDRAGDVAVLSKQTDAVQSTIEVKTSFRGSDGTFQFCLYRQRKNGKVCTDHRNADFVMLLCVEDDYTVVVFMIPATELEQKQLKMRDPLACKWTKYLVWQ